MIYFCDKLLTTREVWRQNELSLGARGSGSVQMSVGGHFTVSEKVSGLDMRADTCEFTHAQARVYIKARLLGL